MNERTILLVDDDVELAEMLGRLLGDEHFRVRHAADGRAGLELAGAPDIDLVILDMMLPLLNGLEVLRELRRRSTVPVLMLTARGEDLDRILGLELGADDYLAKPFNPRELVARVRAILRRAEPPADADTLKVGDLELKSGARRVYRAGEGVQLTDAEFSILECLLRSAGRLVSKADLSQHALGRKPGIYDRSVDSLVSNLRRKLGTHGDGALRIKGVRNAGYVYLTPDGPDRP